MLTDIGDGIIKISGDTPAANLAIGSCFNGISWCQPVVFYIWPKFKLQTNPFVLAKINAGIDRQIGPHLLLPRFFLTNNVCPRFVPTLSIATAARAASATELAMALSAQSQIPHLDCGEGCESGGEDGQRLSVISESFIRRFWPYYLTGAALGAMIMALMLWLNRNYPNLPTVESDDERKRDEGDNCC